MANPVTVSDIEVRWRPLSEAQTETAWALLDDAWAIVLSNVTDVEARLAATPPTLDEALVKAVVSRMVLRVLRNPEGKSSEQIDDYKFTRDDSRTSGDLVLTDADLALLTPSSSTGAFSIRPSYTPDDPASMAAWLAAQP